MTDYYNPAKEQRKQAIAERNSRDLEKLRQLQSQLDEITRLVSNKDIEAAIERLPSGLQNRIRWEINGNFDRVIQSAVETFDSFLGSLQRTVGIKTSYLDLVDEHG